MRINERITAIYMEASRFRKALEACDKRSLPITLQGFPRGSCGDAAVLLGTFLQENGFGIFDYVLGERGRQSNNTWHSHAWVRQKQLIVDITADQFDDVDEAVIVTNSSIWHRRFRQKVLHPADYRIYDPYTKATLGNVYRQILQVIGTPS